MDAHFGFRDSALPQAGERLILGAIAPPLLPWVLACFRFDGRQNQRVNQISTSGSTANCCDASLQGPPSALGFATT
jgi:hypothetical protein